MNTHPAYSKKMVVARGLIGLVLFFNLQCAFAFLFSPDLYSAGFELGGEVGRNIVRGFGLLFLMWNVPYFFAFVNPTKFHVSLIEAFLMQAIGFLGETALRLFLSTDHMLLVSTVDRFIIFDGIGLVALILAAWLAQHTR
jgi:hypothetical protein